MPDTIRRASDDVALAIRMVARLKEETVARQMEALFYPNEHVSVISSITANGYYLTTQLNIRDSRIDRLEKRLTKLEIDSDNQEQYTIRPNVRIHGFSEQGDDTTDDNVLFVINNTMWLTPKLVLTDIERIRDTVFRSRTTLRHQHKQHRSAKPIYTSSPGNLAICFHSTWNKLQHNFFHHCAFL